MYENSMMKPINIVRKRGRSKRGEKVITGEYDQSTLYACMEISE
jgi:hypothetical protein